MQQKVWTTVFDVCRQPSPAVQAIIKRSLGIKEILARKCGRPVGFPSPFNSPQILEPVTPFLGHC
jgi:hypothetical protein